MTRARCKWTTLPALFRHCCSLLLAADNISALLHCLLLLTIYLQSAAPDPGLALPHTLLHPSAPILLPSASLDVPSHIAPLPPSPQKPPPHTAMQPVRLGLRVWQLICAILVTALMGNNIARAYSGVTSIVNYSLFVGVWWLLTLLYFIPTSFIEKFSIPIVDIAFDALSVLFGFCAAVALPAYLGAHSCNNRAYTISNKVTNSSADTERNCRQAQATTAFLWFGWAAFVATLVMNILSARGSGTNLRGGLRRGPAMSQV
ncbi:hypothetical protein ACN47E_002103 [Coniothyrium glycines]